MENTFSAMVDQDEDFEKQYSPSHWSHRFDEVTAMEKYMSTVEEYSKVAKQLVPHELAISYGNSTSQKVDIFGAKSLPEDAPIFVFVHGGYWTFGRREDSSYFVKPFYDAGVVCAVLGYNLVSNTVALPDIVSEIVEGIDFILKYASGKKSKGVYICGSSAGAHLVTMALSSGNFSENIRIVKGVILISGLYDLHPLLRHSAGNEARITKEIADTCSPMTVVHKLTKVLDPTTRILVVVAEHDSPAFKMQSQKYEEILRTSGIKSEYFLIEGEDHFSCVEKLRENDYVLTKKIINMVHEKQ